MFIFEANDCLCMKKVYAKVVLLIVKSYRNDENMLFKESHNCYIFTIHFSFSFFLFGRDWKMRPLIASVVLFIFVAVTQAIGEK